MSDADYGSQSLWRDTAAIDMEKARELAARLELRGQSEDEVANRDAYLDLLAVRPGDRVLEVGCGSGVVLREIARRVGPEGRAVGLDASPALLAVAHELAEREGLGDRVAWREGDARVLPFPDAEFDVVLAVTSLSHIPEGERAVPEMARVARPGGRVGVFDLDGDGLIIAHPDRDVTRKIAAARSDHAQVDGWLARKLPGLMAAAGLEEIRVRAFTPFERHATGFYAALAERGADVALQIGAITEGERRRWLDALRAEQEAGRFFAGQTHLFVWGIRPLIAMVAEEAEALAAVPAGLAGASTVGAIDLRGQALC